jgi:hypothetical protein
MHGVAFVWNLSVLPYGGCTTVTDDAQYQPHPRASAQGGVITHTTRIHFDIPRMPPSRTVIGMIFSHPAGSNGLPKLAGAGLVT